MKVKELLAKPEAWAQGCFAHDQYGFEVGVTSPDAVCFCLMGAILKCYDHLEERRSALEAVRSVLLEKIGDDCISSFNDSHGHADVVAVVEEANV